MIKKEDFKKLKQLDRIEFLLGRNRLEKLEGSKYINWNSLIYMLFGLIAFCSLAFLGLMNYGTTESAVKILELTKSITIVFIFLIIFSVIWNFINGIIYKKYQKELEEEFFTTKTKPKRK